MEIFLCVCVSTLISNVFPKLHFAPFPTKDRNMLDRVYMNIPDSHNFHTSSLFALSEQISEFFQPAFCLQITSTKALKGVDRWNCSSSSVTPGSYIYPVCMCLAVGEGKKLVLCRFSCQCIWNQILHWWTLFSFVYVGNFRQQLITIFSIYLGFSMQIGLDVQKKPKNLKKHMLLSFQITFTL